MRHLISWMLANGTDQRAGEVLREAFDDVAYVVFAALNEEQTVHCLEAVTVHPELDRTELARAIRRGVVRRTVRTLTRLHRVGASEEQLMGIIGELDFAQVLEMVASQGTAVARVKAELYTGAMATARFLPPTPSS